ncbi:Ig-like domain repeat protein [Pseudokineococcus sp. 5B2Z-1]|uniref:Ig-like domain repeat protein n=1 Tax=Pseudokineococcus sp. 5B2Z-1 TaxID=3132744 RepID=UPI0030B4C034
MSQSRTRRAARVGASALLAVALLPPMTAGATTGGDAATSADGPAQAVLEGEVVRLEAAPHAHPDGAGHDDAGHDETTHDHEAAPADGHEHVHADGSVHHHDAEPAPAQAVRADASPSDGAFDVAAPAGLRLEDGTLVGVAGLESSRARTGDEVRLVVEVPAALEDAVADAAGERRLDAARERPAADGSAVAEAVVTAAAEEGEVLATTAGTVEVTTSAPPPTAAAAAPARPVTVVVADMGAGTETAPTDADLATMVQRASDYWSEQSAGRVTFTLAKAPTYYATTRSCSDLWGLWSEAGQRAGYVDGARTHLVLVLVGEDGKGCGYGVGTVGRGVDDGGLSALANASDLSLVTHELGHNLSLEHANAVECTSAPRQDFAGDAAQAPCGVREYGDAIDVMASSDGYPGSLAAMSRATLGFLDAGERSTVSAVGTSLVELAPVSGAARTGVKDLTVTDPRTGVAYRLENRQATGRDQARLARWKAVTGLRVLRAQKGSRASLALDATPTVRSTSSVDVDRALPAGQTWRSASGGVEVTTAAASGGRVVARVSLARTGQAHGALATTTTVEVPELVAGRTAVLRGAVSAGAGTVVPQGVVTVDVAGARASATLATDGSYAVEVVPARSGAQTAVVDYAPQDTSRWAASSTRRDVVVGADPATQEPGSPDPSSPDPGTGDPGTQDPGTGGPSTEDPGTDGPGSDGPVTPTLVVGVGTASGAPVDAATPAVLDVRLDPAGAGADGEVVVTAGSTTLASAAVVDGAAQVALPVLPGGRHELVVAYDGGSAGSATSTPVVLEVHRVTSATSVTTTTAPTATRGAVLEARVASAVAPTGAVEARLGSRLLARGAVSGGVARVALPVLPAGTHTVAVTYRGDRSSAPSTTSTRLVVVKDAATLEVLPPKAPTTGGGQPVVVRVRAGGVAATGQVRLVVDGRTASRAPLVRGEARLPLAKLPAGRRTVTVAYDGSATALAASAPLVLDVVRAGGSTKASPGTTTPGRGRTTTVAVAVTSPAGTATGDVVLRDARGRALAKGALRDGRVTLTQPALPRGTHRLTVHAAGDALTAPSRSATWTVTVR